MRTSIDLDDPLIEQAMITRGPRTRKATMGPASTQPPPLRQHRPRRHRLTVTAACYDRTPRSLGIAIRNGTNLLIGTFCVEQGAQLLHQDRPDFAPIQTHLGLRCL